MQLGRRRVLPEEREHHLDTSACFYCGQQGQFSHACPVKCLNPQTPSEALVSITFKSPILSRQFLPVTIAFLL